MRISLIGKSEYNLMKIYRLHVASLTSISPRDFLVIKRFFGMLLNDDLSALSCPMIGILYL